MNVRWISACLFAFVLLAAGPVAADEVVVITLDGVVDVGCGDVWTEAGFNVSFTETTAEDCDGGGSCSFGTEGGDEVWLYPSRLVVDLGVSHPVTKIEVDVVDWCGAGCTKAFAYEPDLTVASAENTQSGGNAETLIMTPTTGTASAVAVSSCEGQVSEIRITIGETDPGGCTTTGDCGSFELCIDGECVETSPCEVDGDCDPGWVCQDGFCQPGDEPPSCTVDADCAEGDVCVDGACVEDSVGPECAADGDCAEGEHCVAGACVVAQVDECETDADCGGGWTCRDGECHPGTGPECSADADCGEGETCVYGECLDGCASDAECDTGAVCIDGTCVDQEDAAACAADADCADGEICANGACLPGCTTDADCGGDRCVDGKCVKAPEPDCASDADCGPGFVCASGACAPKDSGEPDGAGGGGANSNDDGGSSDCSVGRAAPMSGLWFLLIAVFIVVGRSRLA